MPSFTLRNLPDATHRALRVRAAKHGRSIEAELCAILDSAVRPEARIKLGSLMAEIGREVGHLDLDIERDRNPVAPMSFE